MDVSCEVRHVGDTKKYDPEFRDRAVRIVRRRATDRQVAYDLRIYREVGNWVKRDRVKGARPRVSRRMIGPS